MDVALIEGFAKDVIESRKSERSLEAQIQAAESRKATARSQASDAATELGELKAQLRATQTETTALIDGFDTLRILKAYAPESLGGSMAK